MDKSSAVAEAMKMVLGAINEADGREMVGRRPKRVDVTMESGDECDPEHEDEEMELIRALEGMHSEDKAGY